MDKGKIIGLTMIDLRKAFDLVIDSGIRRIGNSLLNSLRVTIMLKLPVKKIT